MPQKTGLVGLDVAKSKVDACIRSAGRLAKNDPIDAETTAWFGETFPEAAAQTHDPAREEVDRLVQARAALKEVKERIA